MLKLKLQQMHGKYIKPDKLSSKRGSDVNTAVKKKDLIHKPKR
jgi:hypothetical protein